MPHYHRGGGSGIFSLTLMFSAFSLLFLYLVWLLPALQLIVYLVSSLFVMGIMLEERTGAAVLSAMAVFLLGLLILPDKTLLLPYVFFFGHYGIGKYLIERRRRTASSVVLKLVYFNGALALLYFTVPLRLFALLPFDLPLVAFLVVLEAVFLVYDFLFSKIARFYDDRIRRRLTGSFF
jgi:hypothetical protein